MPLGMHFCKKEPFTEWYFPEMNNICITFNFGVLYYMVICKFLTKQLQMKNVYLLHSTICMYETFYKTFQKIQIQHTEFYITIKRKYDVLSLTAIHKNNGNLNHKVNFTQKASIIRKQKVQCMKDA